MSTITFSHILLFFLVYLLFLSLNLSDLLLRILDEKIKDYTLNYKLVEDLGFNFKASYIPNKILKGGLVCSLVNSVFSFSMHEALSSIPI